MDRMTKWNEDKVCFEWACDYLDDDILNRLAEYEEIGTPGEFENLKK